MDYSTSCRQLCILRSRLCRITYAPPVERTVTWAAHQLLQQPLQYGHPNGTHADRQSTDFLGKQRLQSLSMYTWSDCAKQAAAAEGTHLTKRAAIKWDLTSCTNKATMDSWEPSLCCAALSTCGWDRKQTQTCLTNCVQAPPDAWQCMHENPVGKLQGAIQVAAYVHHTDSCVLTGMAVEARTILEAKPDKLLEAQGLLRYQ